jgi:flagellar FliJ protein
MATTNTSVLDTLIEQTRELLNDASSKLAESRKNEKQTREFLESLLGYRVDYTVEMQRQMTVGMDAMTVANYRAFLTTLDDAIEQANSTVKGLVKKVEAQQANWQDQYMKINAYETLIDRREKTLKIKESRMEQRQTDESSSQMRQRQTHNALSTPGL